MKKETNQYLLQDSKKEFFKTTRIDHEVTENLE